jgi:hypothetical protein
MATQVHRVVENSQDFDYLAISRTVHDGMPPATTSARDVNGSKTMQNFVTCGAVRNVRSIF